MAKILTQIGFQFNFQNFYFGPIFRFLTKILYFGQNFSCWSKNVFLSFLLSNFVVCDIFELWLFDFWRKCFVLIPAIILRMWYFSTLLQFFCLQNFYFCLEFRLLAKSFFHETYLLYSAIISTLFLYFLPWTKFT